MPYANRITRRMLTTAVLSATIFLAAAVPARAARGHCGQPISNGDCPISSDALFILNVAVGLDSCPNERRVCDVDGSCATTAVDALISLRIAVGESGNLLRCDCSESTTTVTTVTTSTATSASTGLTIIEDAPIQSRIALLLIDSDIDSGWNGNAHNVGLSKGSLLELSIARRCSGSRAICEVSADCAFGESCSPACDSRRCTTQSCEIIGPQGPRLCLTNLSPCESAGDCPGSDTCEKFFGTPQPLLTADGSPLCVTTHFERPVTGTFDLVSGATTLSTDIRSRIHLGISPSMPCPQCGAPDPNLRIGDAAACVGGPSNGAACVVEAISPEFGGASNGCAPAPSANITGFGVRIPLSGATSGSISVTAQLPCGHPWNDQHPSSGSDLFCADDFSACTTNADCGAGVPCGFYCHCGFCDDGDGPDPNRPCFGDDQCDGDGKCSSDPADTARHQERPNGCESFICGQVEPESCCSNSDDEACPSPTPPDGLCDVVARRCTTNSDCLDFDFGSECILTPKPCFENTITRTGAASPVSSYCIDDENTGACTSNADCAAGSCVRDASIATLAALTCTPPTSSNIVNSAFGWPGPTAMSLKWLIATCHCGDGELGCGEQCDDGNTANGDGCDENCWIEPF